MGEAAKAIGIPVEGLLRELEILGYGATVVLNTVLTRSGTKVGVITTRGFEQIFDMGRGKQGWTGFTVVDRIHARTHHYPRPMVPMQQVRGVTERMDSLGKPVIPLYENEVEPVFRDLVLDQKCEAVVIGFLFSWQNPEHELRAKEIVRRKAEELGLDIDVYTSYEVTPTRRELPRINSAIIAGLHGEKGPTGLSQHPGTDRGARVWRNLPDHAILGGPGLGGARQSRGDDPVRSCGRPDRR